jgi:UDP-glucose 4-epimerase
MQLPLKYLRDNLVAAANLLEQAVAHGVGRFILSSTANLFDDPATIPIDADERIVPVRRMASQSISSNGRSTGSSGSTA